MLQCSCLLCLTPSLAPFVAPMPYHDIWLPMEVNQDNNGYSNSLIVWMWDASLNLSAFHSANTLAAIWRMQSWKWGKALICSDKTVLPRRLVLFPVAAVDDLINEALWGEDLWIRRWVAGCSCNYSIYALHIYIYYEGSSKVLFPLLALNRNSMRDASCFKLKLLHHNNATKTQGLICLKKESV